MHPFLFSTLKNVHRPLLRTRIAPLRALPGLLRAFTTTPTRRDSEHPIGVNAALRARSDPSFAPRPTLLQNEFDLTGRVAVVSGAHRGLGLEMAEALCEAGAVVHCLDLPDAPGDTWRATQAYVARLGLPRARLEYARVDVTDQRAVWDAVAQIAEREGGRMDVCVAAAAINQSAGCLAYPAAEFAKVVDVNVNGVLYLAQAAGSQMVKYGIPGSIVLVASAAGSVAAIGHEVISYSASKAAVIQMARTMACELGPKGIRVNSISPGYIRTEMTEAFLDVDPRLCEAWSSQNPLGRLGKPEEMRGVVAWLASDASTFCTGSDILVCGGHHAW